MRWSSGRGRKWLNETTLWPRAAATAPSSVPTACRSSSSLHRAKRRATPAEVEQRATAAGHLVRVSVGLRSLTLTLTRTRIEMVHGEVQYD